jgi:hypothetical protein
LAINIAQRFNFSGQAVSTRGLSFAFFQICSLLVSQPLLNTPDYSTKAEFSAHPRTCISLN